MKTEPSVIVGGITAFVAATIGLLVAFGVDLDPDKQTAILGMTAVLAPLLASIVIRSKVWSPASVDKAIDAAAGIDPIAGK